MAREYLRKLAALPILIICALCLLAAGCKTTIPQLPDLPNELNKTSHPDYTIAPPDILLVDAVNLIPRPPYKVAPLDGLLIRVTLEAPDKDQKPNELYKGRPIDGLYRVGATGEVDLGFDYGSFAIGGLTIPEAKKMIMGKLKMRFKMEFDLTIALVESRALQQIRGEHLVRQDGKVMLGIYGSVYVAGLTVDEAKHAIEAQLAKVLFEPEVSVDVTGYNSKVYYVIIDLGEAGQQIVRLPVTGNETVLDAIGQIRGLPPGTDHQRIWVARRSPAGHDYSQVLPVNWNAIVCGGSTATNYQILPGDRVYVSVDRMVLLDQCLAKMIAPLERVLGITLLGSSTLHAVAIPLNSINGTGTVP